MKNKKITPFLLVLMGLTALFVSCDSDVKKCTVSYETEFGTAPESVQVLKETVLTKEFLPELQADGQVFGGWFDGETQAIADEYIVLEDVLLKAKWTSKTSEKEPEKATEQESENSDNKEDSDNSDNSDEPQKQPEPEEKVYTYKIIYHDDSKAANKNPVEFKSNEAVKISALSKKGYTFAGWYYNKNFSGEKVTGWSAKSKTADVDLYAKWTPNQYEIIFAQGEAVGGQMENQTFTYSEKGKIKLNNNLYKAPFGKYFACWVDSNGTEYSDGESISIVASDITLTPVFNYLLFSCKFYENEQAAESCQNSITFSVKTAGTIPDFTNLDKIPQGKKFYGWYENVTTTSGDIKKVYYQPGAKVELLSDVDLHEHVMYAEFIDEDSYIIVFHGADGCVNTYPKSFKQSDCAGGIFYLNNAYTITKRGYHPGLLFASETDHTPGTDIHSINISDCNEKKEYHVWVVLDPMQYDIDYEDDVSASNPNPRKHTFGTKTVLEPLTEKGYSFKGWKNEKGEFVTEIDAQEIDSKITLYAVWEKLVEINVTVNSADLNVTYKKNGNKVVLTAPENFHDFNWNVPFTKITNPTAKSITIDFSNFAKDVYVVYLQAKNTNDILYSTQIYIDYKN